MDSFWISQISSLSPTGSSSGSTSEANARRGKATKGQRRWNSNFVASPPWFQVRSLSIVSIVPSTAASFRAPFSQQCLSVPEPALFVASLALACRSLMCVARLYPRCTVFRSRSPLCIAVPDTSVGRNTPFLRAQRRLASCSPGFPPPRGSRRCCYLYSRFHADSKALPPFGPSSAEHRSAKPVPSTRACRFDGGLTPPARHNRQVVAGRLGSRSGLRSAQAELHPLLLALEATCAPLSSSHAVIF